MKYLKLPSIIGYMAVGVILGPSVLGILSEDIQGALSYVTDIVLAFVALSIGIELSFSDLKKQGAGIISVILIESFSAFLLVGLLIYLATKDLPLAILFGALAPASAPAGTIAVIHEYRTKGPLTRTLFSVVGFDDALGIIIFGFAAAFAKLVLRRETGSAGTEHVLLQLGTPLLEVGLSAAAGIIIAYAVSFFAGKLEKSRDVFVLIFGMVLLTAGLSHIFDISLILTNMIIGITIRNTQKESIVEHTDNELSNFMPLLFLLFFVVAGSHLHVSALPSLGITGIVYIFGRTTGLIAGARIGAAAGGFSKTIQRYLGLGILSQAGVAIGLSLIIKNELAEFGSRGVHIGRILITTVTASSIFFEIFGPILTKFGLKNAGEISEDK